MVKILMRVKGRWVDAVLPKSSSIAPLPAIVTFGVVVSRD
jgi:hypothetical protein